MAGKETDPAQKAKLLAMLDFLADKKHAEEKVVKPDSGATLPDGKSVRVENGDIVIGGSEKGRETFSSEKLAKRVTDDAKGLSQFRKIEPFLKTFFREGVPMSKEAFEDAAANLGLALKNLSDELEPGLARNKVSGDRTSGERRIDLYDPNAKDPTAVGFRNTVAELNKKHFDSSASAFRIRP